MAVRGKNAVNPGGLTSILTRQCEKSVVQKTGSDYSRLPKEAEYESFAYEIRG